MFNQNLMNKNRFFAVFLSVLLPVFAWGQEVTVSGNVTDSSTGEPIPFASIQLKGTMTGGNTDIDGNYSISVPQDGVLIFSSIGFKTVEVPVAGIMVHDVVMDPDSEMLDETIVVAFGTATRESFTGSATVVNSSDISKVQSSNPTRALEGLVAGVQMTTSSGALGSSPSIRIRGASSINAGTEPLYIVDGVPYSGDMNNLNPNDIESMTVLKDAASNALYGARGANGVIMITTKKAKAGKVTVNVDAKWGWNSKALLEKIDPAGMEGYSPNSFSHQIRKSVDTLRRSGISVSFRKSNGERLICLKRADGVDDPTAGNTVPIDPAAVNQHAK